MTRTDQLIVYVVMAVWSIIGAAGRIVLQVAGSIPLDALPFVSALLGIAALAVAFTARAGRAGPQVVYTVMAVWLIVAAAVRFALAITGHHPIDVLPFISLTLGLTALVLQAVPRTRTV